MKFLLNAKVSKFLNEVLENIVIERYIILKFHLLN